MGGVVPASARANRTRPKTREQILKEYQELKYVAEKRAADRMLAGKSTDPSKNFFQGQEEVGKAADIAAKKIGLSGKHYTTPVS